MLILKSFSTFFSIIFRTFFQKEIIILFNLLCSIIWAIGLSFKFSFTKLIYNKKESGQILIVKISKEGDFENPKVPNRDFSTKSVPY
jgi:hypothetical protein